MTHDYYQYYIPQPWFIIPHPTPLPFPRDNIREKKQKKIDNTLKVEGIYVFDFRTTN